MSGDPAATVQLVRHATLLVTVGDTTLLVGPMLAAQGADPPVENTSNRRRNPLVDLSPVDLDHDAVLVTHRHDDHSTPPPVTGAVVRGPDATPSTDLTGDTVRYEGVAETLAETRPSAVIVNAGGARFREGEPITIDGDDVRRVREAAPNDATVAAVHSDAINHCLVTRSDLRDAVDDVVIPDDGDVLRIE